jgi:hypothetical protein
MVFRLHLHLQILPFSLTRISAILQLRLSFRVLMVSLLTIILLLLRRLLMTHRMKESNRLRIVILLPAIFSLLKKLSKALRLPQRLLELKLK